ncbi:MAG: alpha/beta hydrolase [Ramlibacter sp.]|nr:alpha/beta hydrolase [Ramlibacter sp.]
MGEILRARLNAGTGSGPAAPRWFWHYQLKKPFFGRFMKAWRWPAGVPAADWRRITIDSASHSRLAAILRLSPTGRGVVVCAHPMGMACKGFWLRQGHAQALLDAGYHVLAFDFNGFGESPSTNFDYPADAVAAGRWARRNFPGLPVHALGVSFGAMNTLSAMDRPDFPYDSVAAEGIAPSLPQFWKAYPFPYAVLMAGKIVTPEAERRLRPLAHLAGAPAGVPLLLIHSRADRWTPVAYGDEMQAAAAPTTPLRRLILDHADHTYGMRDEPQGYLPAVLEFFEETQERLRVQGT